MHNEYTVIAYLYQDTTILAFFHIRVLKLACKPCYYWIKAFNKTISTKFSIKNSHDKWYTKQARPGFVNANMQVKINTSFLHLVKTDFCKEQIALGKTKTKNILKGSVLSEITLDDLDSIKDKKKQTQSIDIL